MKSLNYKKIILVGFISAFVAVLTSIMGVAGTIIGSVISSVLYNMLTEALEKPVGQATFSTNFEWDMAYVFPLVVILIIQLMLILAFLSEWGILPSVFLNIYLSIQGVAANNLYRILGVSLVVMSVYPFIIKRVYVEKSDGLIIAFVALMFLIRGFSDTASYISPTFGMIYDFVDFPIALIAFLLLIYVINNIVSRARASEKQFKLIRDKIDEKDLDDLQLKKIHRRKDSRNLDDLELKQVRPKKGYNKKPKKYPPKKESSSQKTKINESSNGFQFESNDLLDDYKK